MIPLHDENISIGKIPNEIHILSYNARPTCLNAAAEACALMKCGGYLVNFHNIGASGDTLGNSRHHGD